MQLANPEHFLKAKSALQELACPAYFIHSDILRGFPVKVHPFSSEALLEAHMQLLEELTGKAELTFPAFNLSYPKTRIHDVNHTPSEMGHLSEYFRTHRASWRDEIPMHSLSGNGKYPVFTADEVRNPWSEDSYWNYLTNINGYLLFYGAGLDAISYLHFLENTYRVPYRYEKKFPGTLITKTGEHKPVCGIHIVRPMELDIHYDWIKLQREIQDAALWTDLSDRRTRIFAIDIAGLWKLWSEKLQKDPLYFLDENTRIIVLKMLGKTGHAFTINDFE